MNSEPTKSKNELWKVFAHSGNISDYLNYRSSGDANSVDAVDFRNSDRSQTP